MITEQAFDTLRTKEQLGYIVFSGVRRSNGVQGNGRIPCESYSSRVVFLSVELTQVLVCSSFPTLPFFPSIVTVSHCQSPSPSPSVVRRLPSLSPFPRYLYLLMILGRIFTFSLKPRHYQCGSGSRRGVRLLLLELSFMVSSY